MHGTKVNRMGHGHTNQHGHETPVMHDAPDAWHDHSHDQAPQHEHAGKVQAGKVMGIGIALFLAVVVSCVVVYGFYGWYVAQVLAQNEKTTPGAPLLVARDEKTNMLQTLRAGGTVKLPPLEEGKPWRDVSVREVKQTTEVVVQEYLSRKEFAPKGE